MASSAFDDKAHRPDAAALSGVLGEASAHWDAIVALLEERSGTVVAEWKFYGKKLGWQLKLSHRKRALIYLVPREGCFLAATALPPASIATLGEHDLPPALVREIEESKTYPEGKPARVEVRSQRDAEVVASLLAIKLGARRDRP